MNMTDNERKEYIQKALDPFFPIPLEERRRFQARSYQDGIAEGMFCSRNQPGLCEAKVIGAASEYSMQIMLIDMEAARQAYRGYLRGYKLTDFPDR